jgi:CheY-like chemotaxis protein
MSTDGKLIICADDDLDMHALYRRFLEKRGYRVVCCENGEAVLAALDAEPAHLVILDLNMPGMSGMDTLEQLRKRLDAFNVPVIIVSAEDSEESIVDGLSCGADEYIVKPFKSSELLAKVAIALRKKQASAANDLGLALGSRFAGRYELRYKVGTGGFSTVYNALDTNADPPIPVALKVFDLPPSRRNDRQFMSVFLREAYEHSRLDHPNITKLHDFGQLGGVYFMAMEFIHGRSLEDLVSHEGPLNEFRAAFVCYQMSKALGYMSEQGIIHRDIKPANIMLTAEGEVKLLDFGLAKKQSEHTLSLNDEFKGTPQFVSPEYIRDDPLDIRSDVYSLGGTIYYLLTGLAPMRGTSTLEILKQHLTERPLPLRAVDERFSVEFSDLVERMLEKQPEDRPPIAEIMRVSRAVLTRLQAAHA